MDHGNIISPVKPIFVGQFQDPEKEAEGPISPSLETNGASTLPADGCPATVVREADEAQADEPASSDDNSRFNVIPRSQRRGLFAAICLLSEVDEPRNYPRRTKWFITFIIACAAATASLGSAIILPSLAQAANDLGATTTVTNLSVALFMLSMSIFPLWWAHLSESLGRRSIYLVSFALFVVFALLSALSSSVGMLIAMRMLAGGAAASVQAVGAGTIADLWESRERGKAMGLFYIGPLCGPLFAPIIGGALGQRWGWRSTQWFLVVYGGLVLIFLVIALPETLRSTKDRGGQQAEATDLERVSTARSAQKRATKWLKMTREILIDPLAVVLYLRFPPIFLTVYYASIAFGSLYLLNISLQDVFSRPPYNFSTDLVGLVYIPSSLGFLITSFFCGKWSDVIMERAAIKAGRYDENGKLIYRPEDRMAENAWIAAILFPGSMLWYGWAADKGVFWIVPLIGNIFFGCGTMIIFTLASTMLTEFMHRKPATGVAVNNFMRNIFSCAGTVAGDPLFRAWGNGWLFTALGLIAFFSGGVVWAMKRFGPRWRQALDKELN